MTNSTPAAPIRRDDARPRRVAGGGPLLLFAALALAACRGAPEPGAGSQSRAAGEAAAPPSSTDAPPATAAVPPAAGAAPRRGKVLLIGLDGVRPDVLREVPTPNIDALIAGGAFSDHALTGMPSISGPGWTSMLTGVWKEKHGIVSNAFPFPDNALDRYPDFLTRLERLHPELNTFAVADWPPLVSAEGGGPVVSDEVDVKVLLDGEKLGWAEADERSVAAAVTQITEGDPDALFVYLGNPDEVSHHTGSIEDEYRASIRRADRHVGRLVEALRSRPGYADEDWLILVSTDHGRRPDGGHGGETPEERTIFFIASGPSVKPGTIADGTEIVDVAATALAHMGLAIDPVWGLDGESAGLVPVAADSGR